MYTYKGGEQNISPVTFACIRAHLAVKTP
jgi:hypothetical protein